MLLESDSVQVKDFAAEFKRRFDNFCDKAPALLSYRITPTAVILEVANSKGTVAKKVFRFDFTIPVKQNIKIIRDWLFDYVYPVLIQEKMGSRNRTDEEIQQALREGADSVMAILGKVFTRETRRYRIERVILERNELIVRCLETNKLARYVMKMPVMTFLADIDQKNPIQAFNLFFEKGSFIAFLNERQD